MKRLIVFLFAAMASASAQQLWVATAVYTAANIGDGITTTHFPDGIYEVESAWLYGRKPTAARYYPVAFGIEAAQVALAWKGRRSRHKWIRAVTQAQLWIGAADHAEGFSWNLAHGYY